MPAPSSLSARAWHRLRRKAVDARDTVSGLALLQAARLKRMTLGRATFIAVTGSCGKTTTTKLIGAILTRNGSCAVGDGNNTEKAAIRAVLKGAGVGALLPASSI